MVNYLIPGDSSSHRESNETLNKLNPLRWRMKKSPLLSLTVQNQVLHILKVNLFI